jgi:hypothetical protein
VVDINKIDINKDISKVKTFDHLVGKEIRGRIVDYDILQKAIGKCVSDKRNSHRDDFEGEVSDAFIIQEFVEEDDVIRAISSAMNLKPKQASTEIKFDDVRNMSLGLDNLEGYTDAEREFVQSRLNVYKSFYFGDNLVAPNDEFQILDLINMELDIMQLNTFIRMNKKCEEEKKALKEVRLQYSKAQQDLNLKKQQRDNTKEKPKDTNIDLTTAINQLDKSVSDMQLEVEFEKQQEREMIKKLSKKDKKNTKEDD